MNGFDEVSLTCDFKTFSKTGEALIKVSDLGFEEINEYEIAGGSTIKSSADIFINVLQGTGTDPQNNVVLCNAAIAIQTIKPEQSFADCFYEAESSLVGGLALKSFRNLIG